MRFGQRVILYRDGVPYEYCLTFKGWVIALLMNLEDKLKIRIISDKNES